MITDLPLPPNASRPPWSRNHWAPWNRHVYVGEYFRNRAVVGSRIFIARTKFGWFPPIVLIPDWENPTADRSSSSSDLACVVIVVLVAENESRIDKMFCAAFEYASAVLPNSCQSCRTVGIFGLTASSTLFASAIA